MADYVLRGTKKLIAYARAQGVDMNMGKRRMAASVGLPVIHFVNEGRDGTSFVSPKYNEAQAQSLAAIIGVTVANVTTNGGQEIVG